MRTLLIGQAPSRRTDGLPPFAGDVGQRIAGFIGIPHDELGRSFELRNVFDQWPGPRAQLGAKRGDAFPKATARERVRDWDLSGRRVVFVGRAVADAFLFTDVPACEWAELFGLRRNCEAAWIPHPSGLTIWYNDAEHRAAVGAFLRAELAGGEDGQDGTGQQQHEDGAGRRAGYRIRS